MRDIVSFAFITSIFFLLSGCTSFDIQKNGKYVGHYKVGEPYKIKNVKYYPKEVLKYDKTGFASWYGPGFHGKKTANGETFNQRALTAAHPTLPLPSIVRVTNLANNKSVILRVNDRGPYKKRRLIDLSERAAEILNIKKMGVSRVRVHLLPNATRALHEDLKIAQASSKLYASNKTPKLS